MPDMSMCENKDCPSCESCYRFMATPSRWLQSYGAFKPQDGEDRCNYFSELYPDKIKKQD